MGAKALSAGTHGATQKNRAITKSLALPPGKEGSSKVTGAPEAANASFGVIASIGGIASFAPIAPIGTSLG